MLSKAFNLIWMASLACAAVIPITNSPTTSIQSRAAGDTAANMILGISPASASCAGAQFPTECATATQAAPYLINAFIQYKITNVHEMAAVLSLIAFESGDFKYNIHHFPSTVPGQGTRNMQSLHFNYAYAASIPALQSQVAAIGSSAASLSADSANKILALVTPDAYSWASGAWFLTSQCSPAIRQGLQAGGQTAYETYLTGCIQVGSVDAGRIKYWKAANAVFGI